MDIKSGMCAVGAARGEPITDGPIDIDISEKTKGQYNIGYAREGSECRRERSAVDHRPMVREWIIFWSMTGSLRSIGLCDGPHAFGFRGPLGRPP